MEKFQFFLLLPILLVMVCCSEEDKENRPYYASSIAPKTEFDRENDFMGCLSLNSGDVEVKLLGSDYFSLDNGYVLYLNGEEVGRGVTAVTTNSHMITAPNQGYNYLSVYSSQGKSLEVVCTINGSSRIIRSDLNNNGYLDLIVQAPDITCSGVNHRKSDIMAWINYDPFCGFITAELKGYGSKTLTHFYSHEPHCNATGTAIWENLAAGTYELTLYCDRVQFTTYSITVDGSPTCYKILID